MSVRDMLMAAAGVDTGGGTDDNFENVTLLLNGDGTNGAQNNTFVDSSTNNFTITRNGNTTQGSFSPYGSLWSNYFDGTSPTSLSIPYSANYCNFGTGDFTIEYWVYQTAQVNYTAIVSSQNSTEPSGGWILGNDNSQLLGFYVSGTWYLSTDFTSYFNKWTHVSIVRQSGTLRLYINGVQQTTASVSGNITGDANNSAVIGHRWNNTNEYFFKGYISNLRIVKGTCLYNNGTTFTPSTTPLTAVSGTGLLICQSNRFIDNSSNAFALTINGTPSVQRFSPFSPTASYSTATIGGSGYFDGSGDTLQSGTNVALGSSDFTLETWVYYTGTSGDGSLICEDNGGTSRAFMMYRNSNALTHAMYLGTGSGGWDILNNFPWNTSPKLYTWNHFAVTRSGNTIRLYLNGVLDNSTTISGTVGTRNLIIGGQPGTGTYTNGYMTDSRILVGTALYTGSTYTVPTSPLTAVSNTQLLLNYTNAGISDSAMMNDLETVGNAQVSTSVKKYGTGSLYFDGTGDKLISQTSPNFALGTGDFTIEAWVYPQIGSANYGFFALDGRFALVFFSDQGQAREFCIYNGSSTYQSDTSIANNTWTHLAVARSNGTWKMFVNGVEKFSGTNTTNYTETRVYVGTNINGDEYFTGYIDDLRVTKGYARYTANFTPPTAALPTK